MLSQGCLKVAMLTCTRHTTTRSRSHSYKPDLILAHSMAPTLLLILAAAQIKSGPVLW